MPHVRPNDWIPIDVEGLERDADAAVRSQEHCVVVAGPGAGKTELLAQRACFLLQTGICPPGKRILAISFKRDAAKNLGERVRQRCGKEQARTFDSLTFDAFAKGLVDRFRKAIPERLRPSSDYDIAFLGRREIGDFLDALTPPQGVGRKADVEAISRELFLRDVVHKFPLNQENHNNRVAGWAAAELWKNLLTGKPSRLSFPMIGRLAELLLRSNPFLLRALRQTYEFVFLDEFQDTTRIQFDLVSTAFLGSRTVLTAVGDNKQRIMGWAEALADAFGEFESRFGGKRLQLRLNFRSASRLVEMQRYLAAAIDPTSKPPKPAPNAVPGEGVCRALVFDNVRREAEVVADEIVLLIADQLVAPSDVCILVKQRAPLYTEAIIEVLRERGIRARIESEVQDLLAEPVVASVIPFLRLVAGDRSAWASATNTLAEMRYGFYDEKQMPVIETEVAAFAKETSAMMKKLNNDSIDSLIDKAVALCGGDNGFRDNFPQYAQGIFLQTCITNLKKLLNESCVETKSFIEALDRFEGRDSVPIMTIHKSKGLEYHTVIFIGLEDGAFWSFRTQSAEDMCAFFVAFSRAKKQVLFTFSKSRVTREGYSASPQQRREIGVLYELLLNAGVQQEHIP